jgi:hypothetical protein
MSVGEAHAENGQFDKACEAVAKALTLATQEEDKETCRVRMRFFKQGKPYREPPPKR